jgi:hypothetical protein
LLQNQDEIFEIEHHRTECSFSRIVKNFYVFIRESIDEQAHREKKLKRSENISSFIEKRIDAFV